MIVLRRCLVGLLLALLVVGCVRRGTGGAGSRSGDDDDAADDDADPDDDDADPDDDDADPDDDDAGPPDWQGTWYGDTVGLLESSWSDLEGDGSGHFEIDADDWAVGSVFCNFEGFGGGGGGNDVVCEAEVEGMRVGDELTVEIGCLPDPAILTLAPDPDGDLEVHFRLETGQIVLDCRGTLLNKGLNR